MLLVRALVEDGQDGDPVPVLVPAAGWNAHSEHLHDWLARQLVLSYPVLGSRGFGPEVLQALVTRRKILPVVDGLDELPDPVCRAVPRAITGTGSLVLTCRGTPAGLMVRDSLLGNGGVVVEPVALQADDAAAYLRRSLRSKPGGSWHDLLSALDTFPGSPIARALTSPLALWLLRAGYVETQTDPTALCDLSRFPTATHITDHLFDHFVEELIRGHPRKSRTGGYVHPFRPRRAWDPHKAARWLGFLAHHLHATGSRDLAWWRLTRAVSGRLWRGFWTAPRNPAHASLQLKGRIGSLMRDLRWGLLFALFVLVAEGLDTLLSAVIDSAGAGGSAALKLLGIFAIIFGALGIFLGLMRWCTVPATIDLLPTPHGSLRRDLPLAFVRTVVGGLGAGCVGGLAIGIAEWRRAGPDDALVAMFAVSLLGIAYGLVLGLLMFLLGATASGAYFAALRTLAVRRRLPWRLMRFLDDMHRIGLLHQTGAVYQFRYPQLQDRLAHTHQNTSDDYDART